MSESVALPRYKTFRPFDDATLAALDAAHGDIRVVRGETPPAKRWSDDAPEPPWEAAFRKPTSGECDTFEGAAHNERAKPGALRNFAKALVIGVSVGGVLVTCDNRNDAAAVRKVRDAWDSLRRDFPGAHMAASDDLTGMAGMAKDEGGKD